MRLKVNAPSSGRRALGGPAISLAFGFALLASAQPGVPASGATLEPAVLHSPANGASVTYGQTVTFCYTIPSSWPNNSSDPAAGPSTRLDFYLDGDDSFNEPDNSAFGTKQCPIDTPSASPGAHTWWVVLTLVNYDAGCSCWIQGDSATSEKRSFTIVAPPDGPVGVSIDRGATYTTSPQVDLRIVWPAGATNMVVSNDGGFATSTTFGIDRETIPWTLASSGAERLPKTVYVRFKGDYGGHGWTPTDTFTDDIILDETPPTVTEPSATQTASAGKSGRMASLGDWSRLVASSTGSVAVTWSGSDNNSGLATFELQASAGSGPWGAVTLDGPTVTTYRATLAKGSYRYRVRASDRAGNVSAWAVGAPVLVTDSTPLPDEGTTPAPSASVAVGAILASPSSASSAGGLEAGAVVAPGDATPQPPVAILLLGAFLAGLAGAGAAMGFPSLIRRLRQRSRGEP